MTVTDKMMFDNGMFRIGGEGTVMTNEEYRKMSKYLLEKNNRVTPEGIFVTIVTHDQILEYLNDLNRK